MTSYNEGTNHLQQALNDAAWEMNSNNYVVLNVRVENVWKTFSGWLNENAPDEMNYIKFLNYTITNYRVPGGDLKDYL